MMRMRVNGEAESADARSAAGVVILTAKVCKIHG
jgi:hypothetical protein